MLTLLGTFERYIPDPDLEHSEIVRIGLSSPGVTFFRNSAGDDWYDVRASLPADALIFGYGESPRTFLCSPAVSTAVPDGITLYRVNEDWTPEFRAALPSKIFDPSTMTFSEPPPVVLPVQIAKADLWRRATDAEAEQMDALLSAQPVRTRNIFRDAQFISPTDELYPTLLAGLTQLFGAARAAQLLAPSA